MGITSGNSGVVIPTKIEGLSDIVDIAAGYNFMMALTKEGQILTLGSNGSGQLGDGTKDSITSLLSGNPTFATVVDAETQEIMITNI